MTTRMTAHLSRLSLSLVVGGLFGLFSLVEARYRHLHVITPRMGR